LKSFNVSLFIMEILSSMVSDVCVLIVATVELPGVEEVAGGTLSKVSAIFSG